MSNNRPVQIAVGVGVGVVLLGATVWLFMGELKDKRTPVENVAQAGKPEPVAAEKTEAGALPPGAGMPLVEPRATPLNLSETHAPPVRVDAASLPVGKRMQNRAVPLAQLPAEMTHRPVKVVAKQPAVQGRVTARDLAVNVAPSVVETVTPGPKVADPLTEARGGLVKDAGLTEWFDQWQVDHAAERATPAARVGELEKLLSKTSLGVEELMGAAGAVVNAEGAATAVSKAWHAAALDRAERAAKANPGDEPSRRKVEEIRAAMAKQH